MKTVIQAALMITLLIASQIAGAAPSTGRAQKWQGSGVAMTPGGVKTGRFQIEVTNTWKAAGIIQSETKITLGDGSVKALSQTITLGTGHAFQVESNLGKGGGVSYGGGLTEIYIQGTDGKAFAITSIEDGGNSRRQLIVELEKGKAVRILRDKLTRVQ